MGTRRRCTTVQLGPEPCPPPPQTARRATVGAALDDPRTKILTAGLTGRVVAVPEGDEGLKERVEQRRHELRNERPVFQPEYRQGGLIAWKDGSDIWQKRFDDAIRKDELEWKIAKQRDEQERAARGVEKRRSQQRAALQERKRRSFAASVERGEVFARKMSRQRAASARVSLSQPDVVAAEASAAGSAASGAFALHQQQQLLNADGSSHAARTNSRMTTTPAPHATVAQPGEEEAAIAAQRGRGGGATDSPAPFTFHAEASTPFVPTDESQWSHIIIPKGRQSRGRTDSLGYSPEPDDTRPGTGLSGFPRRSLMTACAGATAGDTDSDSDSSLGAPQEGDLCYDAIAPRAARTSVLTGTLTSKYPVFFPPAKFDHYQSTRGFRQVSSRVFQDYSGEVQASLQRSPRKPPFPKALAATAPAATVGPEGYDELSATFCSTHSRTPAVPQPPPPPTVGAGRPYVGWKKGKYACSQKEYQGFKKAAQKGSKEFFLPERGQQMRALPEDVQDSLWRARASHDKAFNPYKSIACAGPKSSYYLFHLDKEDASTVHDQLAGFEERLTNLGLGS